MSNWAYIYIYIHTHGPGIIWCEKDLKVDIDKWGAVARLSFQYLFFYYINFFTRERVPIYYTYIVIGVCVRIWGTRGDMMMWMDYSGIKIVSYDLNIAIKNEKWKKVTVCVQSNGFLHSIISIFSWFWKMFTVCLLLLKLLLPFERCGSR